MADLPQEIRDCPDDFAPLFGVDQGTVTFDLRARVGSGPEAGRLVRISLGYARPLNDLVENAKLAANLRLSAWQALELVRLGRHAELKGAVA